MIRTRFAPSPTGELHLGNLRIAVFNHLFARHGKGAFVVRVEDTDPERNRPGALERILDDLRWAGLDWDEGPDRPGDFGPYRQSERAGFHRDAALRLLESGAAYRCFCTDGAGGEGTPGIETGARAGEVGGGCPGGCRDLAPDAARKRSDAGEPAAIRFRVPAGTVDIKDEIRGDIHFDSSGLADFVILRSDGRPTYNLAVVVDDIGMEISHVIRGAGHLSNTPKHALLFDALGAPRPRFAHLPMVLGADRRKLSKRESAAAVRELREAGYHPDGVVNYVSLLGWSPGGDREVLGREELVHEMNLERVGASDTVFDPDKLLWMSTRHIALMPSADLAAAVRPHMDARRYPLEGERLIAAVDAVRTRLSTFGGIDDALALLFPSEEVLAGGREAIEADGEGAWRIIEAVRTHLAGLDDWTADTVGRGVREAGAGVGARGPGLFHPVRLALTGDRSGPDLALVLVALGREESLRRLASPV